MTAGFERDTMHVLVTNLEVLASSSHCFIIVLASHELICHAGTRSPGLALISSSILHHADCRWPRTTAMVQDPTDDTESGVRCNGIFLVSRKSGQEGPTCTVCSYGMRGRLAAGLNRSAGVGLLGLNS